MDEYITVASLLTYKMLYAAQYSPFCDDMSVNIMLVFIVSVLELLIGFIDGLA